MAEKSTSFVVDFGDTNDKVEKRRIPRKSATTFSEAVKTKYLHTPDISQGNGYVIVFQGRPRTKSTSEDEPELAFLTNVCLTNSSIRTLGSCSLKTLCPNVVDLDISGNLLDSWGEILGVLSQLNNLKFVNLSRNKITLDQDVLHSWSSELPSIENLVLNTTGASWNDVLKLSQLLPRLKELHLCGNGYRELPAAGYQGLHSVECLRMNDNNIIRWEEIWKLCHLPNLKTLILSGNPLADVFYMDTTHQSAEKDGVHQSADKDGVHQSADKDESHQSVKDEAPQSVDNDESHQSVDKGKAHQSVKDEADQSVKDEAHQSTNKDTSEANFHASPHVGEIRSGDCNLCLFSQSTGQTKKICDTELNCDPELNCDKLDTAEYCGSLLESVINNVVSQFDTHTDESMDETEYRSEEVVDTGCSGKEQGVDTGCYTSDKVVDNGCSEMKTSETGCEEHEGDNPDCFASKSCNVTKEVSGTVNDIESQFERRHIDDSGQGESVNENDENISCDKGADQDLTESANVNDGDNMQTKPEGDMYVLTITENRDLSNEQSNCDKQSRQFTCETTATCNCSSTTGRKPFNSLETLCVSETHIGKWSHIGALRQFPALKSVRIKNVKLASKLSDEDRRKLFVASLPNIERLNGSEVTHAEREKSERHLLRHFSEKKQKPDIYHTLEKKHGRLTPLVDIDIGRGYQDYVSLGFVYHGKLAFTETVCVREPVGILNRLIEANIKLQTHRTNLVLYHKKVNQNHDPLEDDLQEIRGNALPMSRLDFREGDEIHIDDSQLNTTRNNFRNTNATSANAPSWKVWN